MRGISDLLFFSTASPLKSGKLDSFAIFYFSIKWKNIPDFGFFEIYEKANHVIMKLLCCWHCVGYHTRTTILRIMKTIINSPDVICDSSPASGKRKQNYNLFKFFKKGGSSFLRKVFAVLQNFMGTISAHASALLALQKHIFLQNTQPGPTTHSRGWRLKGFSLFSAFIFLIGANGWGQTANTYTFAASSATWSALASPSSFTFQTSSTADEDYSNAVTIPFTFNFSGTNYTTCFVSTNGWLRFGSPSGGQTADHVNSTAWFPDIRPAVFPLWDDLQNFAGTTYKTEGSTPNRIFKVQWNQEWNYGAAGSVILMQVWLYETTNAIEFYYTAGNAAVSNNSSGASIGILDGASNYLSLSSSGASPTASSSTFTTNIGTRPANGQRYRFTPPVVCSATTYYSKSTGNLDQTSSWSSTADGTGCSPANFTTAGVTYIIQQNLAGNATRTIGANWTVSGAGSKVVLGQASAAAVTFTVPNNFSFTGTIDVPAASSGSNTFVLNNTTVPTLGILHSGSTVKYNATGSQTIQATTYGNLETGVESGTSNSTKTVAASGTLSIAGNLTINAYSTFNLNDRDMTLTGDFIRTSTSSPTTSLFSHGSGTSNTVTFNGSSQEVNVTSANGTTPTNGDITFNHVTIDGSNVKLFYYKTNDRKLNINNFTVNSGKVVTLYSNPQP